VLYFINLFWLNRIEQSQEGHKLFKKNLKNQSSNPTVGFDPIFSKKMELEGIGKWNYDPNIRIVSLIVSCHRYLRAWLISVLDSSSTSLRTLFSGSLLILNRLILELSSKKD
jgi:hypothetical protein